jgi:hypothetical protein
VGEWSRRTLVWWSSDSRGWRRGLLIGQWLTTSVGVRVEGMPKWLPARGRRRRLVGRRVARGQGGVHGRVSWIGERAEEADTGEVLNGRLSNDSEQGGTKGVEAERKKLSPNMRLL